MSSMPLIGEKLSFILLGGHSVNANALIRFYVLHTVILPLALIMLIVLHLWRLHKDGGMDSGHGADSGASGDVVESKLVVEGNPALAGRTLPYWELLFRETIAIEVLMVALVWIALRWNAPLEQLADPTHTPAVAKAPWYFTGLQELLHYFPPFVAGIILPGLIVAALVIIPFFNVNIRDENLWHRNKSTRLSILGAVVAALSVLLISFHAWDTLVPVWIIAGLMLLASQTSHAEKEGFRRWLSLKSLSFWIMTWFLMEAATLTAVGTFFRGPAWTWVWPWNI
jgi:quinol-cytochrome oxidoreductase complex cytochrome b subunit